MSANEHLRNVDKPLHIYVKCHRCSKPLYEGEIVAETHKDCLWTDPRDGEQSLGIDYEFWCADGR